MQVQSELDLLAPSRSRCHFRDGLANNLSYSYQLWTMEGGVSKLRWLGIDLNMRSFERDRGWSYLFCGISPKSKEEWQRENRILVIENFTNIFLEEVSGLPLSREVGFTINLVSRTSLVLVALYRMALA